MEPVRSVERALTILFQVVNNDMPIALTEVSKQVGLNKVTTLRLLSTLEQFQLVRRDPKSRRYSTGGALFRLPQSWRGDLRRISLPRLEALRAATSETVSLVCPRGLERVVLEALAAPHELCVVPVVGTAHPIYAGASGKVLMAYASAAERENIIRLTRLKPLTPAGETDPRLYRALLRDVRANGYAYSAGDVTIGAAAIAAPVFDEAGKVTAVVALRSPEVRLPIEHVATLAPRVIQTANEISADLGFDEAQLRGMSSTPSRTDSVEIN